MLKKVLVPAAAAASAVLLMSSSAFAMDCFVVKRSNQGATSAGHSSQWFSIPVAGILADDPANGGFGFCPAQVDAAIAALKAAGLPTVLATRTDKILLEGTGADRNGKTADGKGIDHFEESPLIGELIGVATAAAAGVTCS
jgi:hypothetical protein